MLSGRERFSGGHVASVYQLNKEEAKLFPGADLVRVDSVLDPSWFARLYYKHKVASLLYPDNFMVVVGASIDSGWPSNLGSIKKQGIEINNHNLYSQMAAVNPDHATYANHLTLVSTERKLLKSSRCVCEACIRHGQEHIELDMTQLAQKTSDYISSSGIIAPTDDPGDYCLTEKGILFFELKSFNPKQIKKSLNSSEDLSHNQQTALHLLDRYLTLEAKVRLEAMIGKAIGIRLYS